MSWGEQTNAGDGWGFGTVAPSATPVQQQPQSRTPAPAASQQQYNRSAQAQPQAQSRVTNNAWGGSTTVANDSWGGATAVDHNPPQNNSARQPQPTSQQRLPQQQAAPQYQQPNSYAQQPTQQQVRPAQSQQQPQSRPPPSSAILPAVAQATQGDARSAVQAVQANTRALEDCERRLGTRDDTRELRARMQQLRKETLAMIQSAQRSLQARPDRATADQLGVATQSFTRVAQRLEQREQTLVQTMQASLGDHGSSAQVSQAQKQSLQDTYGLVDDQLVEEYNQELRGLVEDLKGLQEVQAKVNTLVTEQQPHFDTVEKNVQVSDVNIQHGTADIEETRDIACAIRWKKLIIALVVIGILAVIAIIIAVSVTQSKPKPAPPPGPAAARPPAASPTP